MVGYGLIAAKLWAMIEIGCGSAKPAWDDLFFRDA
jgi:hypothetical protein